MSALYVQCSGCTRTIPAALLCRGINNKANKGLWYQRCDDCGFHKWVPPPDLAPYSINPGDGYGVSPFPDDESLRSPPPPFYPTLIDPTLLDPALVDSSPPPPPAPATTQTVPPPPTQATGKRMCARKGCGRQAAARDCTHKMCKPCCGVQSTDCGYIHHRNTTPIQAANGDPSALARPPPVTRTDPLFPGDISSLSPDALPADLPPKHYKKIMGEAWSAQYRTGMQKQEKSRTEAEEKRVFGGGQTARESCDCRSDPSMRGMQGRWCRRVTASPPPLRQ
ncbi:hypothetical protein C8R46DRAFT_1226664 [Mycena filopes]|nr:hypothetical protein C8R46DRAFT_1226664 [Mycena filopes]